MDTTTTLLELRGISKRFAGVTALKNVSLTIKGGQVHTLLGENGAGKSTLIKILAGVHQPSEGIMLLNGDNYNPANPKKAAESGISVVFQELSLCNHLTVAENIFAMNEPNFWGFINKNKLYKQAHQLVKSLGLPVDVYSRVADLSIAQRQLVEITKGLSRFANIIILDEPTSSLSDSEAEILFNIIFRLKSEGKAIIYISHRMGEIMHLSDEITVMRDGECIATIEREKTTVSELISMMVGRQMDQMYPPKLPETPNKRDIPPALELRDFTYKNLFNNISFCVYPGEILGFFGLVGAGRSEVMNGIFGMLPATGEKLMDGEHVIITHPKDAIHYGIGFVTENRKEQGLVLSHAIRRNMTMAALKRFSSSAGFLSFKNERISAENDVQRLNIKTTSVETQAMDLSGGNQQKVVLAKWLGTYPHVLILDEPTRGVDVGAKFEIYKIIRQLAAARTAILLISSELPELMGLSDRMIIMHEGYISAILEKKEFEPKKIMAAATGQTIM
ncbi:MAG TPA: D-xylose ABC transporter ATP-binding protein [Pasteurellaceae bacterium]|nr:D-xylose ABC transporter ATP-binding protein [Pasteurellaceae bacterium]